MTSQHFVYCPLCGESFDDDDTWDEQIFVCDHPNSKCEIYREYRWKIQLNYIWMKNLKYYFSQHIDENWINIFKLTEDQKLCNMLATGNFVFALHDVNSETVMDLYRNTATSLAEFPYFV